MNRLLSSAAAGALAIALAACGAPDDRPEPITKVTEEQAQSGLAALGLEDNPRVEWDDRDFDDGVYTFTNFRFLPDTGEGPMQADSLVIAAPRVEAGGPVFDGLSMDNLSLSVEDGAVTIETLRIDRPGPELARAVSAAFTGEDGALDDVSDLALYRFAELGLEGLSVTAGDGEDGVSASLSAFTASDFDGERLGALSFEDFQMNTRDEDGRTLVFSLDEVSLEGLGAAVFHGALLSAEGAAGGEAEGLVFANPFNPAEMYERFAVRGLDIDADGVRVVMADFTGEVDEERGGRVRSTMDMPTMTLSTDPARDGGAQLQGALMMLGYETVELSMRGESVYDPQTDRARTEGENYLEMTDGFRLDFEQDFGGIEAYAERYMQAAAAGELADGDVPPEVLEPLVLHRLALRLEDRSLLERGLGAAGAAQGMTAEQMRAQSAGLIGMGLMMAPAELPRPLLASISQALVQFIGEGGVLAVEINPDEPLPMSRIATGELTGADMQALGLTVAHEPGSGN